MMENVEISDARLFLGGHFGLICGPSLSLYPNVIKEISEELGNNFGVAAGLDIFQTTDNLISQGRKEIEIRDCLRRIISQKKPSGSLTLLSQLRFSSILSFCWDTFLEERIQNEADSRAIKKNIAILHDLMLPIPPRATPSYKLLGTSATDSFAFSSISFRKWRLKWSFACKSFGNYNLGNPVLCVGVDEVSSMLFDLLVAMMESNQGVPSKLIFLAQDSINEKETLIKEAVGERTRLYSVNGTLDNLIKALKKAQSAAFTPILPFDQQPTSVLTPLVQYEDIAVVVNNHLEPSIKKEEHNRLVDLLFAPSIPNWDPFCYGYDFLRSIIKEHVNELSEYVTKKGQAFESSSAVLRGSASSGKTVASKRIAFELAKSGFLVVWVHSLWHELLPTLKLFFSDIKRLGSGYSDRPIFVFIDDPPSVGNVSAWDIVRVPMSLKLKIFLHISVRESDWTINEEKQMTCDLPAVVENVLPDVFQNDELDRLPEFLVKLRVFNDLDDAKRKMKSFPSANADVLCLLFWLLPETRHQISMSIRDEYFRLGNASIIVNKVLEATKGHPDILQKAYAMVAVADHYKVPLPIEVLVSALGVGYTEWSNAISSDGPAWGILYDETSKDGTTITYRTRNSIITKVLLEVINSSSSSKFGEVRILKELISGCCFEKPIFRNFCAQILINNSAFRNLDFEGGASLYEQAAKSLPAKDKAILHHHAKWVVDVGRNPIQAQLILDQALEASTPPYASKVESDENIHTTYAATAIVAIEQKHIDIHSGKEIVNEKLMKARRKNSFDPYIAHVQASLIRKLIRTMNQENRSEIFKLVTETVSEVDKTLLFYDKKNYTPHQRTEARHLLQRVKEDLFTDVLGGLNLEDMKSEAEDLWEKSKDANGFLVVIRKLYSLAVGQDQGKRFNTAFSYYTEICDRIVRAGCDIATELHEVGLQIYYHWQVRNRVLSGGASPIDWNFILTKSNNILHSLKYTRSPIAMYLSGIAQAHLGSWDLSLASFSAIRGLGISNEVLWEPRDFLLNPNGGMRKVQGTIKVTNRTYLHCEALRTDFRCDDAVNWPSNGAIAHAHIQFSFGGMTAISLAEG